MTMDNVTIPLNSSAHAQLPVLPWEVIEEVIDHCFGDSDTLHSLALTCSQLHPRSLYFLYTDVKVKKSAHYSYLYSSLVANPHLRTLIRSLSLPWDVLELSGPLLPTLTGLSHLKLFGKHLPCYVTSRLNFRCGGPRSLTLKNASLTETDLDKLLSAFPNVETLTCDSFNLRSISNTPARSEVRLRNLTMRGMDMYTSARLLMRLPIIPRSIKGQEHKFNDCRASVTWWIPLGDIRGAIRVLSPLKTRVKDITLVLLDHHVASIYSTLRQPSDVELFAQMDNVARKFRNNRVLFAVDHGQLLLNARKTICLADEINKSLRTLNENWALTGDIKYSGKAGHDGSVAALVVSTDGRWVATASNDCTIILWDAHAGCISQEWFAHTVHILNIAFLPGSGHLASAGADGRIAIWEISGSARQIAFLEHPVPLLACTWSSNGAYMATHTLNGTLYVWDARTFEAIFSTDDRKPMSRSPLFSPDSRWLLTLRTGELRLWDMYSRTSLTNSSENYRINLRPPAFSPLSTHLAVPLSKGVHIWDFVTGQEHLICSETQQFLWIPHYAAFSPDGLLLLLTSYIDMEIGMWDTSTWTLVQSLRGHQTPVCALCFSPCGRYIASASNDYIVKVWNAGDGACLATLSDHGDLVAFTPDGTMLWSAGCNGTVLAHRLQDIIPGLHDA